MKIKKEYIILSGILILALLIRLYNWNKYAFAFYDEGIHAFFGRLSSYNLVLGTLYQPPFSFQLWGLIYSIFHTTIFFRLFNIILSVISILLTYIWIKNNFSKKEALISSFLLTINIIHIKYSYFLNQDSLLFCLGVLSLICIDYFFKNKNNFFLFLSGMIVGVGVFTKYTFLLFNGIILIYFIYFKKSKIKLFKYFVIGQLLIWFIFLFPYIKMYFKDSSNTYSISNYFQNHLNESGPSKGDILLIFSNYCVKILNFSGIIFLLFIYNLFFNRIKGRKYSFLIIWVAYYLIVLLSSQARDRYFFMQGLGIIPLIIIATKIMIEQNKTIINIFLLICIIHSLLLYYSFLNSKSNELNSFQYISLESLKSVTKYINNNTNNRDIIMSNEPYLLLTTNTRFPITANYLPHISCPNNYIKYLILFNSSKKMFDEFDLNTLYKYSNYYTLEKKIKTNTEIVYIFKVNGNSSCKIIVPPFKQGFYLSQI